MFLLPLFGFGFDFQLGTLSIDKKHVTFSSWVLKRVLFSQVWFRLFFPLFGWADRRLCVRREVDMGFPASAAAGALRRAGDLAGAAELLAREEAPPEAGAGKGEGERKAGWSPSQKNEEGSNQKKLSSYLCCVFWRGGEPRVV